MISIKLVDECNILRIGQVIGGLTLELEWWGVGNSGKGEKLWYVGQIGSCLDLYEKPTD